MCHRGIRRPIHRRAFGRRDLAEINGSDIAHEVRHRAFDIDGKMINCILADGPDVASEALPPLFFKGLIEPAEVVFAIVE